MYSSETKVWITEENLRRVIAEQREKCPTGHSVSQVEQLEFCEVHKLDLGFIGICRIESLWEFTFLKTLHLNNNHIEKLEGLSRLTNLITLNLSFNSITKIEGLEALTKLEELNLSNNKISVLENMESLENLSFFNIADNNLKDLNQVMYLRKFKNVFALNFSGNSLSEENDYKHFVIAFFPTLKYLDYRYVNSGIKKQALEKFHIELQKVSSEDEQREKETEAERARQAELQLHADAFVESLNGSFLFEHMIKEDPLANQLFSVPEVADQQKLFKWEMTELCVQLFETGLAELKPRQEELSSFLTSHSITKAEIQRKELQLLQEFEKSFKELKKESTSQTLKSSPDDELKRLHKHLLSLEFKLIGWTETMINTLDLELTEMINAFFQRAQKTFSQCQALENQYYEALQGVVHAVIERMEKGEDVKDVPEDVKMVFLDKETVMEALTTAHENHLLCIQDREFQMMTRANAWKNRLVKKLREEELQRNRVVLSDFTTFVQHYEEEIHKLLNR